MANDPTESKRRLHLDRRASDLTAKVEAAGDPDDLLSTKQLAQWLGVSSQFLEIARYKRGGFGPRFIRVSARRIRYKRADVLAWLEQRAFLSAAEYAK